MVFNVAVFFTALHVLITRRPIRARRIAYAAVFAVTFGSIFVFTRLGLLLDELLFRNYRKVSMIQPLFIIGFPRSGTTFLQKLMSLDEENFASIALHQSLVPSLSSRKVIGTLAAVDRSLGGLGAKLLNSFETWLFRGLGDIHPCAFNKPEEDILLAVHSFATVFVYLCVPFIASMRQRGHHVIFIDTLPVTERVRYLRFYESLVKRHLYLASGSRRLLSKSTVLITALQSHIAQFPDAKFIALVRRPHECLPSMMSLTHTIWQKYERDIGKDSAEMLECFHMGRDGLLLLVDAMDSLPPERLRVIRYEDFIADPRGTIEDIYRWMGMPISPTFLAKLEARLIKEQSYRSKHVYSLEEFGLDPTHFARELDAVYRRFVWLLPAKSEPAQMWPD
jgi:omega-hydroxy-beta-dihydromenaquinone-9 sulfotransferase